MNMPRMSPGAWRRLSSALFALLAMPAAAAGEATASPLASAVQQLRHAAGVWQVTTTQFDDRGAVQRVGSGTYRFDWVVPDRVLSGRSDMHEWKQSAGMLFYVNPERSTVEMTSVGPDGQLWVTSGPAGSDTRTTAPTPLADGRQMQLRFTRFGVTQNRFESRMEVSLDGGESWKPGNHQLFVRARDEEGSSGNGLRYRKRPQQYVPLT
jgi:hypothetical protein